MYIYTYMYIYIYIYICIYTHICINSGLCEPPYIIGIKGALTFFDPIFAAEVRYTNKLELRQRTYV